MTNLDRHAFSLHLRVQTAGLMLAVLVTLGGCECSGESTETAPTTTEPGTVLPPAEPSGPLTVGGPPVSIEIRALPGYSFTVTEPGEYQFDAVGAPLDAELRLDSADGFLAADSDSGEADDARLVTFLAAGSYEIHVAEALGRDLDARVSVTQADAIEPVAELAPGLAPAVVTSLEASEARAASVEVNLTIAEAGRFQIDATTVDPASDAEMQLMQNGTLLASDSDSGDGANARIERALTPGTYRVRVRDAAGRAAGIVVGIIRLPD